MERRTQVFGVATLVIIAVVAAAIGAAALTSSDDAADPPAPPGIPAAQVGYPARMVAQNEQVVNHFNQEDPVKYIANNDDRTLLVTKDDLVTQMNAYRARLEGLPYSQADLLAPTHYESGKFAGYIVTGVEELITFDEVSAPGFDLCAVETASLMEKQAFYREQLSLNPGLVPEGATTDLSFTPAERLHCTPR